MAVSSGGIGGPSLEANMEGSDILPPQPPSPADQRNSRKIKIRNLVAFWLLGLCNNYGFIVMLSAAYDILEEKERIPESDVQPPEMFNLTNGTATSRFDCNSLSTGVVLLADVLPAVVIDVSAPWFADYIPYDLRVATCVVTAAASFLVVALLTVDAVALSLMGVVFAGISSGLGEFTYISLMSFYDTNVVSTWSSGTGASGLISALTYAGLTEVLTPRNALLVMLVVPAAMIISYWGLLVRVHRRPTVHDDEQQDGEKQVLIVHERSIEGGNHEANSAGRQHLTLKERFYHLKHLLKYMIPLILVYVAQYFINQGLLEFIYFKGTWLTHERQYRWFQVLYRLGMFISRSSVNIVKFKRLWVFSLLQWCVMVLILTEVYFAYMPSIAIAFAAIFFEGFVGGLAYVNTFYQIREKESPKYKEFAMGTTILATAIGTTLAGAIAMPVHDALCQL